MPILPIILIAVSIFAGGYASCWSVMTKQVIILESQIDLSNHQAADILRDSTIAVASAESAATVANVQLESEHDKSTKLNLDLHNSIINVRMRDPGKHSNGCNAVPKNQDPADFIEPADTGELSAELSDFLKSESFRADTLAVYADECHKFVASNCGIK